MQYHILLFAFTYLAATVLGGGPQGCMERVLAFQAYEIDALNPVSEQTMGYTCDLLDDRAKQCMGKWIPCSGTEPGGRCNYYEFLRHMGKLPNERNWAVYRPGNPPRLDTDATTKRCVDVYKAKNGNKGVRNFAPWQTMKGLGAEFNVLLTRMNGVVDKAAKDYQNDGNRYKWDDFDATRTRILAVRAGDHGEKVIAAAKDALGSKMNVKTMNLGTHPTDPSKTLEALDWKATIVAAEKAGVANYKDAIKNFYRDFYEKRVDGKLTTDAKSARDHRAVNRTYKKTMDRSRTCR